MKRIKARRMTLLEYGDGFEIYKSAKKAEAKCKRCEYLEGSRPIKTDVATIDVSDEAALVEVGEKAIKTVPFTDYTAETLARAVLEALGVVRRKKSTRKPKPKEVSTLTMHDIRASYEY